MAGFPALAGVLWSPPPSEAVRRVVDRVYRDPLIQRDLPVPERAIAVPSPSGWRLPDLGSFAQVLLWALVGVVAAVVVLWAVREVRGRRRRVRAPLVPPAPVPDAWALRAPLEEAAALAAQGRWAEAVHALLLKTLATMVAATGTGIPPALTSREILARIPLRPDARGALAGLVDAVEASHFGTAEAGPDDYEVCLARFRRFTAALGQAAA